MTTAEPNDGLEGDASVSVVMTTYNGACFIKDAIRSVLNQTHPSLEVLVVDDGSADATPEIIHRLASMDSRIRFEAAPHSGIASSRNKGLALAGGRFITFLDQDDLFPPGRIARQYARLTAAPNTAAVFGKTIMFEQVKPDGNVVAKEEPSLTMLISAALFRREAIQDIGLFDTTYAIADDFDYVLRLIESAKQIEVEDLPGVFHRRHAGQHTADRSATRSECTRALQQSLRRRRKNGVGSLKHPLATAGDWPGRR